MERGNAVKLEVGSLSDTGRTREHNEDYLGMFRPAEAGQRRRKGELFLVADGIGGHQSGEVASRMAVEHILQAYASSPGQDVVAELVRAVESANAAIYALGQGQDRRWRMGTTLVGALVRDRDLHIVNVGDSRAYLVRGARVEQISQDHSLVAEQVRLGLIDAEQAKSHDYRSTITRALGNKPEVKIDTFHRTLQAGDIIVLCTDGLSGLVNDDEIARIVSSQPPAQAVTSLVAQANARGGKDNITTIVVKAHEEAGGRRQEAGGKGNLWWLAVPLIGIVLVLAAVLVLALFFTVGEGRDLPLTAPVIAPIEFAGEQAASLAPVLGYEDENDLWIKARLDPRQPVQQAKPNTIYVLITGRVVRVDSERPCRFALDMGGSPHYFVECDPGVPMNTPPIKGRQVSVLGELTDEPTRRIKPITIDVNTIKWLGLGSEWKNGYNTLAPGRRLLVYTIASSYTVPIQLQGVNPGDRVAVYGPWNIQKGQFVNLEALDMVFKLEGMVYKKATSP